MSTPRSTISERDFQHQVVTLARLYNWRVYSIPDSRRSTETGFPDLMLWNANRSRSFLAELKTEKGRLSADQVLVIDELRSCGHQVYVWRPSDWPEIEALLTTR